MTKKNLLLLKSKNDIPFFEGQVNIHQPTINEISLINEENFHIGVRFLAFDKNELNEDNLDLEKMSDFDILMSIINERNSSYRMKTSMVLTLLFPDYHPTFLKDKIILANEKNGNKEINQRNFDSFKENIINMFCLDEVDGKGNKKFNPSKGRAEKIAEKLERARRERDKRKGRNPDKDFTLYGYYISVLAVGEQKDWNVLMDYTVPQLLDEFNRFQRKVEYDSYAAAAMAGAENLDEVTHWMIDE